MRITLTITVLFVALLVVALIVPMSESSREITALCDFLHAPGFAVFAVLILAVLRRAMPRFPVLAVPTTWVLVAGFGFTTEVMQRFVGRDPSWQDVWADALGAGAGALWAGSRTASSRRLRLGIPVVCGLMLVVGGAKPLLLLTDACRQRFEMPKLASFEHSLELSRWIGRECRVKRVRSHATHGSWALRVDMQPGGYPGVALEYPLPDWSDYDELVFDVDLDNGPPLELTVKIEAWQHRGDYYDRFDQVVRLMPGRRRVRIALSDVAAGSRERALDLRSIRRLQLFAFRLDSHRTLHLDNLRLR